jgi:site-specific recombinase XerD
MARRTEFEPKASDHGWRLNIPAKFSATGKRERHFFATKEKALAAAKTYRKKRDEFGHQAQAITPSLAESATIAAEILAPWKLSLVEAARIVADIREKETASTTLSAAGAAWLSACEGLRDRTKRNYRLTIERMEITLGVSTMANIQADEIQAAIAPAGTTGAAAAERIRNAKAFWNWSAKKGWCNADTFSGVEMPKASREDAEIGILTPDEASLILTTAEKHFPQAVASFALQLFAGIRAEELIRLEAGHVTKDGIDMPASVTKKGRRRHITPSPTLSAWLEKYPFEPCPNWRETAAAVRRLCGWEVSSVILNERIKSGTMPKLPKSTRGIWPQNALRHSHASYAVAAGIPLENLLFEFGHAGNPTLLRQHYVGRASKKQALDFFAIVPEGAEKPQAVKIAKKGVA